MKDVLKEELKVGDFVLILSPSSDVLYGIVENIKGVVWNGTYLAKYAYLYKIVNFRNQMEEEVYNSLKESLNNYNSERLKFKGQEKNVLKNLQESIAPGDILLDRYKGVYLYLGKCQCSLKIDNEFLYEKEKGYFYIKKPYYDTDIKSVYTKSDIEELLSEIMYRLKFFVGFKNRDIDWERESLSVIKRYIFITKKKSDKMKRKVSELDSIKTLNELQNLNYTHQIGNHTISIILSPL